MCAQLATPESAEQRRFWFWLVAAVLALILLYAVMKWTDRQDVGPTQSSRSTDQGLVQTGWALRAA